MKTFLPYLATLAVLFPFTIQAQEVVKDGTPRYVQVEATPEFDRIVPGQKLTIAVEQVIAEHWHTYWKNPGDSGESTRVDWHLPNGFTAGDIQWPVPGRMPMGPLTNFGYSEHVTFLTDITVPEKISGDIVSIKADVEWLVCSDLCVPEMTKIELQLPVAKTGEAPVANKPDMFAEARATVPQMVAWQGMVEETDGALLLSFTPDAEQAAAFSNAKEIEFYPDEWGLIINSAPQEGRVENDQIKFKIPRDTRALSEVPSITGVIAIEDKDGMRKGYAVSTAISHVPSETIVPAAASQSKTLPTDTGLGKILLFAILGGLILNLMPCVFPILSMKALSLINLSAKEKSNAALYGLSYTAGVLVCFAVIAGGLITLQLTGQHIGWGFQLQNPIIVLLLAYLLFMLGLNLSGFFEFNIGRSAQLGQGLTQKHGYAGSFFTGVLATIVATPCTAPFMGVALGYALTQPPIVALSVFLALGFGLALPYLLLCIAPPVRKALPKPGAWMETFRQFLSFPMYASVAWLIWVYGQQVEGMYDMLLAMIGLVLIAFGLWLWKRSPRRRFGATITRLIALFAFSMAVLIAVFSMGRAPIEIEKLEMSSAKVQDHSPYSKKAFDEAFAGNNPVFVNMTASWCITCKVNERVALATDDTRKLFKDKQVVYLQGDWTNQNPEITDFLKEFGRNGVPLYVYYGPRDPTTNQRPEPVVLPQLLTEGLVADIFTNL